MVTPSAGSREHRNHIFSRSLSRVRRKWMKTLSSGSSTSSGNERSWKLPNRTSKTKIFFTFLRCRVAPSFTKAFCLRPRSPTSTEIFLIPMRRARFVWCTSASRRTLFPAGSWRIPIAMLHTMGRSTRLKAMSHGCMRASPFSIRHCSAMTSRSCSLSSSPAAAILRASITQWNCYSRQDAVFHT